MCKIVDRNLIFRSKNAAMRLKKNTVELKSELTVNLNRRRREQLLLLLLVLKTWNGIFSQQMAAILEFVDWEIVKSEIAEPIVVVIF